MKIRINEKNNKIFHLDMENKGDKNLYYTMKKKK